MEMTVMSLPELRMMIGKVVSMVVAPPTEMGASLPNRRARSGENRSVDISLRMLLIRAIVPSSAPLNFAIKMLLSEYYPNPEPTASRLAREYFLINKPSTQQPSRDPIMVIRGSSSRPGLMCIKLLSVPESLPMLNPTLKSRQHSG